ncbi:MAG: amidohydrolase family protein [Longimicrobiales bacterium]
MKPQSRSFVEHTLGIRVTRHASRITRPSLALIVVVLPLAGCGTRLSGGVPAQGELALTHVTVVDVVNGRLLANQTVVMGGGRITRIGGAERVRLAPGVRALDGSGKYVLPGLLDMHAHLTLSGRPTEIELPLFVAHGVTGVRVMGADCRRPVLRTPDCLETYREWRRQIEAGPLSGPRLLALGSWPVNGPSGITDSMPSYFKASSAEEGRQLARYFKQRGVDFIKVYNNISRAGYLGLAEEARLLGLPFAGHEPMGLSALELASAGQGSIEHSRIFLFNCFPGADSLRRNLLRISGSALRRRQVDEYDARMCADVFSAFVRSRTYITPTHGTRKMDALAHDSAYRRDARMKYVTRLQSFRWTADANGMVRSDSSAAGRTSYMDFYLKGRELTGAAYRAGVPIMVGTDAGDSFVFPGSSVHDELDELIAAGLTPAQAIKAATFSGAEYLGRTAELGSVQTGRFADLVLLDANPLADIKNTRRIHAVVLNGRYLDRTFLDQMLAGVEAAAQR